MCLGYHLSLENGYFTAIIFSRHLKCPEKDQNMKLMKNKQTEHNSEETTEAGIGSCCSCTRSRRFHHRRHHM